MSSTCPCCGGEADVDVRRDDDAETCQAMECDADRRLSVLVFEKIEVSRIYCPKHLREAKADLCRGGRGR